VPVAQAGPGVLLHPKWLPGFHAPQAPIELFDASPEQIAPHRAVVEQADRLFGARRFDRFEMLLALSDEMTAAGRRAPSMLRSGHRRRLVRAMAGHRDQPGHRAWNAAAVGSPSVIAPTRIERCWSRRRAWST
jgi:hypothetical protein